jgi:two-component system, OmpR family, sensor kinase
VRALRAAREWWARRTLRVRITLTVGTVALVALLALSRFATVLAFGALVDATDQELRAQSLQAVARLDDGATAVPGVRVVDMAGQAVDEGPPLPLDGWQVAQLAAGEGVTTQRFSAPRRWVAELAIAPDGTPRLAVASADLVGGTALTRRAAGLAVFGAVLAALVVAGAAWVATRAALRPVDRLRTAAAALPPGDRLPMPAATDEVRALAQELNALLARRDEAVARLERFTGDAAHELRSPVAAIRAQAEVAVAHPDPALADETLRAVAVEAERLTDMLADLMALARADAGQRPSPRPVDVVAAARAAIGRQNRHGAVVKLVAPAPAAAAASPGEVALVLDNLLGNALRHARSLVQVGVLPAGRTVRLVVEDDGPGIPAADRDRVFDRFTRLDPDAESRAGGGAGLGLALVAALVAGRGGTVAAGEAPGGGARLEVRWPAAARP